MTDTPSPTLRDRAIADAGSLPQLVTNLKAVDPGLAQQIEGKSALGSKTLWATPISYGVTFLVSKYGLGWDADTVNLVSGLLALGVAMLMRLFTKGPITSLIPTKEVTP